jgi:hypothetical protein
MVCRILEDGFARDQGLCDVLLQIEDVNFLCACLLLRNGAIRSISYSKLFPDDQGSTRLRQEKKMFFLQTRQHTNPHSDL